MAVQAVSVSSRYLARRSSLILLVFSTTRLGIISSTLLAALLMLTTDSPRSTYGPIQQWWYTWIISSSNNRTNNLLRIKTGHATLVWLSLLACWYFPPPLRSSTGTILLPYWDIRKSSQYHSPLWLLSVRNAVEIAHFTSYDWFWICVTCSAYFMQANAFSSWVNTDLSLFTTGAPTIFKCSLTLPFPFPLTNHSVGESPSFKNLVCNSSGTGRWRHLSVRWSRHSPGEYIFNTRYEIKGQRQVQERTEEGDCHKKQIDGQRLDYIEMCEFQLIRVIGITQQTNNTSLIWYRAKSQRA